MADYKIDKNLSFIGSEHDVAFQHNGKVSLIKFNIINNESQISILSFDAGDFLGTLTGISITESEGITINGTKPLSADYVIAPTGNADYVQKNYVDGVIGYVGAFSTTGRPSATGRLGKYYYDTTLGIPVFSNGSSWRDSGGVAVNP